MYVKQYYMIKLILRNGTNLYYGKKSKQINLTDENLGMLVKEFGFETSVDAFKEMRKAQKKYIEKFGLQFRAILVTELKLHIEGYGQHLTVRN